MSNKRLKTYRREVSDLKLEVWLRHHLRKNELSMSKLSLMLGMNHGYLRSLAKKGDFTGAQLIAIGNYLDINPFEPYAPLLNIRARPTQTEKAQAKKIAELEGKIATLTEERDWLKEVVMKR